MFLRTLYSDRWICVAKMQMMVHAEGCAVLTPLDVLLSISLIGQNNWILASDWLNVSGINSEDGVENATNAPLDLKRPK